MAKRNRNGFGTRFDSGTPNQINDERIKPYVNFDFPPVPQSNRRFCESCKSYVDVASNPKKKFKGWKCNKCKGVDQ